MPQRSVFYQTCPVCGRSLRMPVDAFGRQVTCVHCGGAFRSSDAGPAAATALDDGAAHSVPPLAFVLDCFPLGGRHTAES
jgi:hypothetical protein